MPRVVYTNFAALIAITAKIYGVKMLILWQMVQNSSHAKLRVFFWNALYIPITQTIAATSRCLFQ